MQLALKARQNRLKALEYTRTRKGIIRLLEARSRAGCPAEVEFFSHRSAGPVFRLV